MPDIQRFKIGPRMSAGVKYNGMVFLAGQIDGTAHDVGGQTKGVLAKIDAILAEAGTNKSRLLSANVWLSDIRGFDAMNAVWDAWIDKSNPPARATVEAKLAGPEYLVEIAVVAAVD